MDEIMKYCQVKLTESTIPPPIREDIDNCEMKLKEMEDWWYHRPPTTTADNLSTLNTHLFMLRHFLECKNSEQVKSIKSALTTIYDEFWKRIHPVQTKGNENVRNEINRSRIELYAFLNSLLQKI